MILGSTTILARGIEHLRTFFGAGSFIVIPGVIVLAIKGTKRRTLVQGYTLLLLFLRYFLVIGGDIARWFRFYLPLMRVIVGII